MALLILRTHAECIISNTWHISPWSDASTWAKTTTGCDLFVTGEKDSGPLPAWRQKVDNSHTWSSSTHMPPLPPNSPTVPHSGNYRNLPSVCKESGTALDIVQNMAPNRGGKAAQSFCSTAALCGTSSASLIPDRNLSNTVFYPGSRSFLILKL